MNVRPSCEATGTMSLDQIILEVDFHAWGTEYEVESEGWSGGGWGGGALPL